MTISSVLGIITIATITGLSCVQGSANISLHTTHRLPIFGGTEKGCGQSGPDVLWSRFFGATRTGAKLVIPCGKTVVLDEAARISRIGLLQIDGYLVVPPGLPSRTIEVENILVQGQLLMGTPRQHIQNRIVFKVVKSGQKVMVRGGGENFDFGTQAVVVAGGQLKLYGMPGGDGCMGKAWVHLAQPARKGSSYITVDRSVAGCWKVGHEIGIAPSYVLPRERDTRKITRIAGSKIYLNEPLKWDHTGNSNSFLSGKKRITYTTEVGLLTRNIVFDGEVSGLKGMHTFVAMTQRPQFIAGVEFVRGGRQGELGRYPLHFHMGDKDQGSVVKACSVHNSLQRGIIIHGTDNVKVENNVLFDIVGHGIGFEDGVETNNVVENNLVVGGDRPAVVFQVDREDESDRAPACFWMRGPANSIVGNVAVGCHFGYWYELDESVRGPSKYLRQAAGMNPQRVKVKKFQGNTARGGATGLSLYPFGLIQSGKNLNIFSDSFFYLMQTGIFAHNSENLRIETTVVADTSRVGIDLDRLKNAELKGSLIIGKGPFSGSCPSTYGLELHPIRGLTNMLLPTMVDNVNFDRFRGCANAPISIGNENAADQGAFNRQQSLPASTTLRGIAFMDNPSLMIFLPQSKRDIPESLDSDWTSHVAIRVQSSPQLGSGEGYLISSNNEALRPRSSCRMQAGRNSLFCPGACYRTLEFHIKSKGEGSPRPWQLKLTRMSDNAVDYLRHPTWNTPRGGERLYEFFGNLVGGEEYLVTPIVPAGGKAEPYLGIRYDDGVAPGCTKGVRIVFSQKSAGLAPVDNEIRQAVFQRPCPGSKTDVTNDDIVFYERCSDRMDAEIVVQLPFKFRQPQIDLVLSPPPKPTTPNCRAGTITKCRAFERKQQWKLSDTGREPSNFQSPTFNDRSWKTAVGIFGYNGASRSPVKINTQTTRGYTTIYFRKEFTISEPECYRAQPSNPNLIYDDGFIVYLNGREVLRKNLRSGLVQYNTFSSGGGSTGYESFRSSPMPTLTRTNVVAVEVHMAENNGALSEKDIRFEMYLDLFYRTGPGC